MANKRKRFGKLPHQHKYFLVLLLSLLEMIFPTFAQTEQVAIDIQPTENKFTGLVEFLTSVAPGGQDIPIFRHLFETSSYVSLDTEAFRRFATLDLGAYNYTFAGYPVTHGQTTVGAWTAFQIAAAKASDWDDLRDRTAGLFPNEVQDLIFQAMQDVEPAYDALLWKPYSTAVHDQVDAFTAYVKHHNLGILIRQVAIFYGSTWPEALPIWVAFHPAPPGESFRATVVGNVAISQMPSGFADYDAYASVAFHEVAHRLFAEQPPKFAELLQRTMLKDSTSSRELAYRWLDEALATATSNGWVYAQLTGTLDSGSWYANPIIEGYARALYPRVASYIEAGQAIDENFIHFAVATFETTFPEAFSDAQALFPYFSLVTDKNDSLDALLSPLYERYYLRATMMTNDFDDASIESALKTPGLTVIILTNSTPEKAQLLRKHLPSKMLDTPGEVVYTLIEDHPVLLLRISDSDAFRRILVQMDTEGMPLR